MNRSEVQQLADRLIELIRTRPDQPHSRELLQGKLCCSNNELSEAAEVAQSWGYRLGGGVRADITFRSAPDLLTATEIEFGLNTKWLGKRIHAYQSVKSTNDLAAQLAENKAIEGTIVVAEEQTKGRGRLGRAWHSPPGSGIYLSIILKPSFTPEKAPGLAIMTAVALADAIGNYVSDVRIKWPNDLLISGKKTAGILTELSAEREKINHVIVGVGINVNQGGGSFPPELRKIATSLRRAGRRKVKRVELLQLFLRNFEKLYKSYQKSQLALVHARIKNYSSLIGTQVKIAVGKNITTGQAIDIDRAGCLILQTKTGQRAIAAGEVTVIKG